MNKEFYVYTRKHFEYLIKGILIENKLCYVKQDFLDITEKMQEKGFNINERMYLVKTKNPNRKIIIFSSVDVRTGKTRSKGSDCVRVVEWIKKDDRNYFKRIKKHLRINTLKNNLEKTLVDTLNNNITNDLTGYSNSLEKAY